LLSFTCFCDVTICSKPQWHPTLSTQMDASVLVTRIDDDSTEVEVGHTSDRNWLTGVLVQKKFEQPRREVEVENGMPPQSGGIEAPIDVVLLQHGKRRGDSAGHVEPLLPAITMFHLCAGVSHPAYTGRPAAWLPFTDERRETRFATPYYDGLINFHWNAVQWRRESASSLTAVEWGGEHAVIRIGSVIKYREDLEGGGSVIRQGVVLLTYVQLSRSHTALWVENAILQHNSDQHRQDSQAVQALEDFSATFPRTPVATLCVWRLRTDQLPEGSREWATQPSMTRGLDAAVTVDRVTEVAVPDPANRLWAPTSTPPYTVEHRVSPNAVKKKSVQNASIRLCERTVDVIVDEQMSSDGLLVEWYHGCVTASRAAAQPDQAEHSYLADVVADAARDFNDTAAASEESSIVAGPVEVLMNLRRLLNLPQPQVQMANKRKPRAHPASEIFRAQPSGPNAQSSAAAPAVL